MLAFLKAARLELLMVSWSLVNVSATWHDNSWATKVSLFGLGLWVAEFANKAFAYPFYRRMVLK